MPRRISDAVRSSASLGLKPCVGRTLAEMPRTGLSGSNQRIETDQFSPGRIELAAIPNFGFPEILAGTPSFGKISKAEVRSNLGPNRAEHCTKSYFRTQSRTKRFNKLGHQNYFGIRL